MTVDEAIARLSRDRADADALEAVYRQLWPSVLTMSTGLARGDVDTGKDIAQEVFLRLVKYGNFSAFASVVALRSYLYAICRNVARSHFRAERGMSERAEDAEVAIGSLRMATPEEEAQASEQLARILGKLGDADQKLVSLILAGYSLPEIVSILGLSYSTAAVRVHRLREKVKQYLEEIK